MGMAADGESDLVDEAGYGSAVAQLRVFDPLEFNRIVLKRHRVAVFKQRANEVVGARVAVPA